MYAAANRILGNIVKVTPSSKVVGDLALHLVAVGADPDVFADDPGSFDVPDSVIGFLSGELGDPPGGWPEPFRTKALAGRTGSAPARPSSPTTTGAACRATAAQTLNRLLFPGPASDFADSRERYSDLSRAATPATSSTGSEFDEEHDVYLSEGVRLILGVESISQPDERGIRTVMCTINGQLRPVLGARPLGVVGRARAGARRRRSSRARSGRRSTASSRRSRRSATRSRPATSWRPSRR